MYYLGLTQSLTTVCVFFSLSARCEFASFSCSPLVLLGFASMDLNLYFYVVLKVEWARKTLQEGNDHGGEKGEARRDSG